MKIDLASYMAAIGSRGGKAKTKAKITAVRENLKRARAAKRLAQSEK